MSMPSSGLTGHVLVDLDAVPVQVHNARPEWVTRLVVGKPATALPGLLASLFALCAHAHRATAACAVDAAMNRDGALAATTPGAAAEQMRWDTAREHLRRIWLDWPRLWSPQTGPDARSGAAQEACGAALLRESPLWQVPHGTAADGEVFQQTAQAWLQAEVLGQPPVSWLQAMQAGGEAALRQWADQTETWPAQWLRHAATVLGARRQPLRPLRLDDPVVRALVVAQLDQDPAALRAPFAGEPGVESGPWCRLHGADRVKGEPSLWWRLAARLLDLVRLVLPTDAPAVEGPTGAAVLARGVVVLGEGDALAWTEMARGILLHRVRLQGAEGDAGGEPLVARCQVLSPTEWHAHPDGPLALALRAEAGRDPGTRGLAPLVPWLAAVYDPCVPTMLHVPAPPQEELTCTN